MGVVCSMVLAAGIPAYAAENDEANKNILKNAIQGAITGAVATEATKDEGKAAAAQTAEDAKAKHDKKKGEKNFHPKKKDKKRPHGWDQGKKTGWNGGDEPPGLAKKHD